jgi:4-hydroxy-4-methyl-2-oxoglutarate aldolase
MFKKQYAAGVILLLSLAAQAQSISPPADQIKTYTSAWKGERSSDGRPRVSDAMMARLKNISMEEAWGVLRNKGYQNQFEGDWQLIHTDSVMTGRVVTAQYVPLRPDLQDLVKELGKKEGRVQAGGTNSWPIDVLKDGDVYVADGYGKIIDGTLIGDNLGNSIYTKSKRGVIFYGSVRDVEGLSQIKGFNAWTKGNDPSYIQQMMLSSINAPIRIGRATVLPGDVVLAKKYGTIFIPAHLVDKFGHQRLREGKYTPGEIDTKWTEAISKDFLQWVNAYPGKLPMTKKELDDYLKDRNY